MTPDIEERRDGMEGYERGGILKVQRGREREKRLVIERSRERGCCVPSHTYTCPVLYLL